MKKKEDTKVKEVQQESIVLSGPKGSAQTPTKVTQGRVGWGVQVPHQMHQLEAHKNV